MYTVHTGRVFLDQYNRRTGQQLTARQFFGEQLWPVFFNAPDEKHLMQVTNSAFFQSAYAKQVTSSELPNYRRVKFQQAVEDTIEGRQLVSGALAIGYWAAGPEETTSGQVSHLQQNPDESSIYCSWIGAGLAVGFGGGYDMLFEQENILWHIWQGWPYYRQYINENHLLKGRQIAAWNGLWLMYGLESAYTDADVEKTYRQVKSLLAQNNHVIADKAGQKLDRPDWPQQVLELCKATKGTFKTVVNGFSFGQTNKTLGMMTIELPEIKRMQEVWEKLMGLNPGLPEPGKKGLENWLSVNYSLEKAVQTGGLGLRALAPKDYQTLFPDKQSTGKASLDKLYKLYQKSPYTLFYSQAWIMTLLQNPRQANNEELLQLANMLATELVNFTEKGKTKDSTINTKLKKADNLVNATTKASYLQVLAEIVNELPADMPKDLYNQAREIVFLMPADSYRLFIALLKCTYVIVLGGGKVI
ncbi:MAG: hypothetical protein KF690_00725 [Bacteroidetes bacterium]|nr:hypothetical protein [Bacteroidota bacterium]